MPTTTSAHFKSPLNKWQDFFYFILIHLIYCGALFQKTYFLCKVTDDDAFGIHNDIRSHLEKQTDESGNSGKGLSYQKPKG